MLKQLSDKIGLAVLENEPLKNHTTFKIGGPARFFVRVNNKQDLLKSLKAAHELHLPFLLLGGGSNVLINDKGFDGLVIKLEEGEIEIKNNILKCFAGSNLSKTIREALKNNLSGLEFAANIPGTVGGAVWGNAGAYGKGVGDFVSEVEVVKLNPESNDFINLKIFSKEDCEFEYRSSIFKKNSDLIIAEIKFELIVNEKAAELFDAINKEWQERLAKQPLDLPSAGCAFKNITLKEDCFPRICGVAMTSERKLAAKNSALGAAGDLAQFAIHGKIPVGRLIESVGLKGKKIGGAVISDKHANFIVNIDNASAADVVGLIELAKKEVKNKFGVELEQEIKII
ncbi:MAG: UDP-N-acetylmuramate dehydrogenase [Parcubacteria group bacterium]